MSRWIIVFALICSSFSLHAERLPAAAFGQLPTVRQVSLSPNGEGLAYIRNVDGHTVLGYSETKNNTNSLLLTTDNKKFKIRKYWWASNQILLVSVKFPAQRFGVETTELRLFKVEVDRRVEPTMLLTPRRRGSGKSDHYSQFLDNIISVLPDDPDFILMAADLETQNRLGVYKVSIIDKKRKRVIRPRTSIRDWISDRQGRVRLGVGQNETTLFFRLFDLTTEKWRKIWEYEIFDAPDIMPLGFGVDPNILYIRALHEGHYAVFKVDVQSPTLERELVYADPNYDVEGGLIYSPKTNGVVGISHGEADNGRFYWDKDYLAFQKAIDKALPDTANVIVSMSKDERKYVLYTGGQSKPGAYFYGNRDEKSLTRLLSRRPLLDGKALSKRYKVKYKARDGLLIEGYLSASKASSDQSPLPTIILPHGGPMSRDYAGFDWLTEFLVNRGYRVLQPNFRGSSGYGFDFEMQSIKQWGGKMQDDLQDAANWLVDSGLAAKGNICIAGVSYGGYASLMAAVRQQDTFRCAASIAGVSDLNAVVWRARNFTNKKVVRKQIGTKTKILKQNSPVNFADKINIPVLLIHGDADRIVPVKHSRKMYKALKKNKKVAKYVELENGNHQLQIEQNRIRTLEELDKFFAQNLKP